jgi:excisionase family DNA binding protein
MNGFEVRSPVTEAKVGAASKPDPTGSASDRYDTLPLALDLLQAAALLGLGRTTAYRLVHDNQWPTPVFRLGRLIKIPTQPLLDLLTGARPIAAVVDDDRNSAPPPSSTGNVKRG